VDLYFCLKINFEGRGNHLFSEYLNAEERREKEMNNNSTRKRRILIPLYICMSSIKINNPV